ncbi:MAG: S8 family serine peptidase, partial [Verrucomicrobiae bacterium]|nr:S8 family serine peptidase [Verrucomicrobiae bacterium]
MVVLILRNGDDPEIQSLQVPDKKYGLDVSENALQGAPLAAFGPRVVDKWIEPDTKKVSDSHIELRPDGKGWEQTSIIQTNSDHPWLRVENLFVWNEEKNDYVLKATKYAIADEILVKLDSEEKLNLADEFAGEGHYEIIERLSRSGWYKVKLGKFQSVSDLPKALRIFRKNTTVEISAEPDYLVKQSDTLPNDIQLPRQYYLRADLGINALAGWDLQTDASDIKVAVIDSGIQANHEDLLENLWTNPNEVIDGIDNDGNGYVDDTFGIDVINGTANPGDGSGHGTQVSGLIGATGNNGVGISGIAWNIQLMGIRFLNEEGVGTISDALKGIQYAIDNQADILNLSWGGSGRSQALEDLLLQCNEAGILCVAAAGNSGVNIDSNFEYPASFNLPNLITVGAIGDSIRRATFSNWGPHSVDIMAPGFLLLSTHIDEAFKYSEFTGTSASAPLVSGVAALAKAKFGDEAPKNLKRRIMLSARLYDGLGGIAGTNGIVDLKRVLAEETNVPPNDHFADAFGLEGLSAYFQNSLSLGSLEIGEPEPQTFENSKSLWFSVSRDMDTSLSIRLSGDDPSTALNVYTGDSLHSLMLVSSILVSEERPIRVEVLKDTAYYLQVLGPGSSGFISLQLETLPANDDFAKARQLNGVTFAVTGKNTNATFEPEEPKVSDRSIGKTLWWKFTPDSSGSFYISTFGSETDTLLGVYQGSGFGDLNLEGFNDDQSEQLFTSALSLEVRQGDTYFIQVDSGYNPGGRVSLSGQFLNAPIFLQSPQSRSAAIGDTVIFQGLASGPEPLKYQWRKDGEIIAFQNKPNLVLNSVSEEDFGAYQLEVFSPAGSILSSEALLSRKVDPLKILIQPEPLFLNEGEAGKLGVLVSGGGDVTYTWYRNFQVIPGSNTNQINVGSGGLETGFYYVDINSKGRSLRSDAVWVSPNHGAGKLGTRVTASREDQDLTVIEFFKDQFIAVDRTGRYKLSSDGFTWSNYETMENGLPVFASAIGNGKLVLAQEDGHFAVTSDLKNWDFSQPDPSADSLGTFNKDLVFLHGNFFKWIGAGKILKSIDGLEWTTALDLGEGANVRSISAAAGIVLVVEVVDNYLRLHRSTNGIDWSSQNHLGLQASNYSKASGCVDFFILTADRRYTSYDGVNWSINETPPYTDQIRKIIKVGNFFYAALEGSVIMRSPDGLEWETVFEGNTFYSEWAEIAFGKGVFVIGPIDRTILPVADFNEVIHSRWKFNVEGTRIQFLDNQFVLPAGSHILTSKTGASWEKVEYDADLYVNGIQSIAFGNGIYTLGSASGPALDQMVFRENNMYLGPRPLVFGKDLFIGTGLVWSSNGIDWNSIPLEQSWNIRYVIYANDRFVGVGNDQTAGYSLDGKNWLKSGVAQSGPFFEPDFTSVAFGNGKFVAPAYEMDQIGVYESEDGTAWNFVPSNLAEINPDPGFSFSQGEIAFWNGKFYISGGDSIYISENLTIWDEQPGVYFCNGLTSTPGALFGVGRDGVFRIGEQPGRPPTLVFEVPGQIIAQSGETIDIEVDAFDLDGSIENVTFYVDGDPIKEVLESPYRFSWTVPDWGSYVVKATAVDSSGSSSSIAKIVRASKRSSIPLLPAQFSVRESNATTFKNSGYLLTFSGNLYRRDLTGNWQIAYQFPSGNFISLQVFDNVLRANSNEGIYSTTDGINWNYIESPNN